MRKIIVCSVRDSAAQAFAQPMFFPALGVAQRMFTDEVNRQDPGNNLYKHPGDFELWVIGLYDEDDGQFECPADFRRCLVRGADVAVRDPQ